MMTPRKKSPPPSPPTPPATGRPPFGLEPGELREILDHAPDAKVIVDIRGRIIYASHQVKPVLGYASEELVGQPVSVLIPERFRAGHAGFMRGFVSSPSNRPMGAGGIQWAVTRSGREIPVEISLSSIGHENRRLVLANVRDVSERVAAIQDLARVNRELSQKSVELENTVADLRVFAQSVSHDLQAPLRQVMQFLNLLERRHGAELSVDARNYINCAMRSADRLAGMVQDVLAFTRIGSTQRAHEPVSLNWLLDEVLDRLRLQIEEAQATVTRDDLPTVAGDGAQLTQLIQNLVTNALAYRGSAPPRLHVGCRRDSDGWKISFRDNGLGIAPEYHARIFEMFRRGAPPPDRPGTGVGLAICRRVVERHQGRLWVESTPGMGSTFWVSLPTEPDEVGAIGAVA